MKGEDMALGDGIARNKGRKGYAFQKGYNKAIDDVFDFLKTQRDKKSMKVNFDDLEIRKYKEQLKGGAE
jgi:hypothetical protein